MRGHFFRPAQSCHLEMPKTIESVGGEVILDLLTNGLLLCCFAFSCGHDGSSYKGNRSPRPQATEYSHLS